MASLAWSAVTVHRPALIKLTVVPTLSVQVPEAASTTGAVDAPPAAVGV